MTRLATQDLIINVPGRSEGTALNLTIEPGQVWGVLGPNGAGKSTCFNMLMGQLKPSSGTVQLMGKNIAGMQPRKIWRMGVGRTFQITATYASMTVVENVQMALMSHHKRLYSLTTFAHKLYRDEALALRAGGDTGGLQVGERHHGFRRLRTIP